MKYVVLLATVFLSISSVGFCCDQEKRIIEITGREMVRCDTECELVVKCSRVMPEQGWSNFQEYKANINVNALEDCIKKSNINTTVFSILSGTLKK